MATYLQGVTDYIPQLQPFQPDLNLYANVLQTKQTQYDTAWKSLNSVYGQYYYADLSRQNNIDRKEEIIKNIDFNLKRVAGLDLSLTQNVQQATQVFKPFYEDKYLMKDMAWTKNYSNQRGRAEGYKNSLDEKQRGMYWDGGVRAIDYMREEFQEVSDADSLNFGNAEYTPYVNAIKEAQKAAKEAGLSIESVDMSNPRWIVTNKNGTQLIEPLNKLFEAELGNDPAIQAVYKTQAYLDRKDYAASNAAQFNGDKNAAEMQYLQDNYNTLKQEQVRRYKLLEEQNTVYDAQIKDVEKQLKSKKSAQLDSYLQQLKDAKATNQTVLDRVQSDNDALASQDGTTTTSTGEQNPYGDLKSLRWKVDNARASALMSKDFNEAAQIFAMKDAKQSVEANPYAVNEQKHQFAMQEVALRNQGIENAAKIRNAGEMEKLRTQAALDAGIAAVNPKTGQIEMVESYDNIYTTAELEGATTGEGESYAKINRMVEDQTANQYGVPYMQQTLKLLEQGKGEGVITDADIKQVLGMDLETAQNKFNGNNTAFVTRTMGAAGMANVKKQMDNFTSKNNKLSFISNGVPEYNLASSNFAGYTTYQANVEKWRKDSSTEVRQKLESQGFDDADLLFDKNGHMRGYEEFKANMEVRYGKGSMGSEKSGTGRGFFSDAFDYGVGTAASLWWAGAYGDKESESYESYAKMWRAANEVYKGKMNTKAPPGVSSYAGGGGGIATTGVQNVSVSSKAPGMMGYQYYKQFENELRNTSFSSSPQSEDFNRFSFNGKDEYGFKNFNNDKGQFLANHIISKMSDTRNKFNFDLGSSMIAGNKSDVGAMIIKVTPDMIKDLVSTNEDEDNNVLTKAEANQLYTNGLTVFKQGGWNNGLYTSGYMDPIQAVVDYDGSYSETDVYGNRFKVQADKLNLSDYQIENEFSVIDPLTGNSITTTDVIREGTMGKNLSTLRDAWLQKSELANQYSNGAFNY